MILAIGAVVSLLAYNLFAVIPKEFAPTEDRGVIIIPIQAPEGASLDYTRDRVTRGREGPEAAPRPGRHLLASSARSRRASRDPRR